MEESPGGRLSPKSSCDHADDHKAPFAHLGTALGPGFRVWGLGFGVYSPVT